MDSRAAPDAAFMKMNLTEANNVAAVHERPGPQKQGDVDQLTSGANAAPSDQQLGRDRKHSPATAERDPADR